MKIIGIAFIVIGLIFTAITLWICKKQDIKTIKKEYKALTVGNTSCVNTYVDNSTIGQNMAIKIYRDVEEKEKENATVPDEQDLRIKELKEKGILPRDINNAGKYNSGYSFEKDNEVVMPTSSVPAGKNINIEDDQKTDLLKNESNGNKGPLEKALKKFEDEEDTIVLERESEEATTMLESESEEATTILDCESEEATTVLDNKTNY